MTRLLALALAVAALPAGAAAAIAPVRISADSFASDVPGTHATEVEPSAAGWGSTVVAAFQVGRLFGGGAAALGFATSTDAGSTWRSGLLPSLTVYSPAAGVAGGVSDPVVAYDALHGRWLVASLAVEFGQSAVFVNGSPDGVSWSAPVTALSAPPSTFDKDWLACDNGPSSPFRGHCYLAYSSWERTPFAGATRLTVQTSTDGGASWGAPAFIAVDHDERRDTLSAEPIVRPNGELVILFFERSAVRAVRSGDGGATFGAGETVAAYSPRMYSFRPDRFRGTPIPTVAVDGGGTVYAAWYDCRFRPGCGGNDVVLSRSSAPGVWTQPQRLSLPAPAATADFVLPALAADSRSRGPSARIALAYYALSARDCSGAGCTLTAALATSANAGRNWRASSVGDPMALDWLAPTSIGRMVGDYVAPVFVPGRVIGVFSVAAPPRGDRLDQPIVAASVVLQEPPRNVRRPLVRGAARAGGTLACLIGSWAGTQPIRYSYRWVVNGRSVAGATGSRFRIPRGKGGGLIACRVDAANAAGIARATSRAVRIARA